MEFDIDFSKDILRENRYIKPNKTNLIPEKLVIFENANDLVKSIDIKKGERVYCVVSGSFIFGDFIENFISYNNFKIKELTVCTLSMSKNNIDSLKNLLVWGCVEKLNLIVSGYFYSHEIKVTELNPEPLIPYIYKELDSNDNNFQLAIADTHMKVTQFVTENGNKCIMHGSANLRSSQNIEQFVIEQSNEIYDFNQSIFDKIIKKYKTINKSIRYKELFKLITEENTNINNKF